MAHLAKNLPAMRETWFQSLGWEDPLEKGTTIHSGILAWRIPSIVQSMETQTVGYNLPTFTLILNYSVKYLVRELRSHMLHDVAKEINK